MLITFSRRGGRKPCLQRMQGDGFVKQVETENREDTKRAIHGRAGKHHKIRCDEEKRERVTAHLFSIKPRPQPINRNNHQCSKQNRCQRCRHQVVAKELANPPKEYHATRRMCSGMAGERVEKRRFVIIAQKAAEPLFIDARYIAVVFQ